MCYQDWFVFTQWNTLGVARCRHCNLHDEFNLVNEWEDWYDTLVVIVLLFGLKIKIYIYSIIIFLLYLWLLDYKFLTVVYYILMRLTWSERNFCFHLFNLVTSSQLTRFVLMVCWEDWRTSSYDPWANVYIFVTTSSPLHLHIVLQWWACAMIDTTVAHHITMENRS